MMSIIKELEKRGKSVKQTNLGLRGYRKTEAGVIICKDNCDKRLYILNDEKGNQCPCDHVKVYIIKGTEYEGKVKTKSDAEKLAQEGKIFSFDSYDLYAEYYDFAHDAEFENCVFNNYSLRSKEYIESEMKRIGLLKRCVDYNGKDFLDESNSELVDVFYHEGQFRVGKIEDKWIAELGEGYLSDYDVFRYTFDHKPNEYEIKIAITIQEFSLHPYEVIYDEKQKKEINWLDIPGDIIEKYNMSKEYYKKSLEK